MHVIGTIGESSLLYDCFFQEGLLILAVTQLTRARDQRYNPMARETMRVPKIVVFYLS